MSDWNSLQYLKFKKQRTQPATDLLMRLKHSSPRTIVDVGCGPGNSTLEIANCFPEAKIVGIDSSANMIETAKGEYPQLDFKQQDVLELEGTFDLIFFQRVSSVGCQSPGVDSVFNEQAKQ